MRGARPMTDAEVARVRAQLKPRDHCLFVLGIRTGFRISELLSLKISDVLQGGEVLATIYVRRRDMKGETAGRGVPLHPAARAELAAWTKSLVGAGAAPDSPLFPIPGGRAMTRRGAWKVLTRAYRRAGVFGHLGTHTMRKRYAAVVYERLGHDLIKTQKAMGHASVSSTQAYLAFADSDVNDAITGGD